MDLNKLTTPMMKNELRCRGDVQTFKWKEHYFHRLSLLLKERCSS